MSFLRQKLASFLMHSSRVGIRSLDPDSPCAKVLAGADVEGILAESIPRVCEAVSYTEMTKIFSLVARIKVVSVERGLGIKEELKKIAEDVVARAERESGKFNIPEPCRHLLWNF